jgi:hypothetical protein
VDRDVGFGQELLDRVLDVFGQLMRGAQRLLAVQQDVHVHERPRARVAHAHVMAVGDARHRLDRRGNPPVDTGGRGI